MIKRSCRTAMSIVTFAFMLLLSGCVNDDFRETDGGSNGDGMGDFVLSIQMPSAEPATYAITEGASDDYAVDEVDLLLFKDDKFVASYYCANILPGDSDNVKLVKARLPIGIYKIVLLANSHDKLLANPITADAPFTSAFDNLKFEDANYGTKWNADPTSLTYRSFPMWGISTTDINIASGNTNTAEVDLVRMLAKVNISVPYEESGGTPDFELTSVHVYNYNKSGRLVPDAAKFAADKATEIASAEGSEDHPTPLEYGSAFIQQNTTDKNFHCTDEIFLFESSAKSNSPWNWSANTCVVIGGKYKGELGYYRLDFIKEGDTENLEILRNHRYIFQVQAIKTQGYPDPEEALKNKPDNIQYKVLNWNDGGIGDIIHNNSHYITFDPGRELTFGKEGGTKTINIKTNYPDGWQVSGISAGSWLTTDQTVGQYNHKVDVSAPLEVTVLPYTGGVPREGRITIQAGTLQVYVKVTQSEKSLLSLQLTDDLGNEVTEMLFVSGVGVPVTSQTLNVDWTPIESPLSVAAYPGSPNPVLPLPDSRSYPGTNGKEIFTIAPDAITQAEFDANPSGEWTSMVNFKVESDGKSVEKTVMLRQVATILPYLEVDGESWYRSDGGTYTFRVRSNSKWEISSISETGSLLDIKASDNLKVGTTGGPNTDLGMPITFTTQISPLRSTVTVVFRCTDTSKPFADVTFEFEIRAYIPSVSTRFAGSNIYWDGEKLTFDDEGPATATNQKYQGVYFQWGSLWGISPVGAFSPSTTVYKIGTNGKYEAATVSAAWSSLPHITPSSKLNDRKRAYLYEVTDEASNIGDICRYLTMKKYAPAPGVKSWRMPTSEEMKYFNGLRTNGSSTQPSNRIDGKFSITGGLEKGSVRLPSSGYRTKENGAISTDGDVPNYWTSSPSSGYGYALYCSSTATSMHAADPRCGLPVRCVAEN